MDRIPMTKQGAEQLRAELHKLTSEIRPQIIESIQTARALGDLKENAEYHEARRQQSFTEGRIQEIEAKLGNSQIIDIAQIPASTRVIFGTTVKLINLDTDEKVAYQIVGEDEADLQVNKISFNSPIARGLIGKNQGDEVEIVTPNGVIRFAIEEVIYSA